MPPIVVHNGTGNPVKIKSALQFQLYFYKNRVLFKEKTKMRINCYKLFEYIIFHISEMLKLNSILELNIRCNETFIQ